MSKVSLTGIKPTGDVHIGNYFGAIKPALRLAETYEARYFIADYHALNTVKNRDELVQNIRSVAASWLAAGLDPNRVIFYRQSSIPETFELSTILMCFTAKGLMNRAHAYKAAVQANLEKGEDPDAGINMGLYTYPVLMAADILLFDTHVVPVGKDQVQHVEMAQDIAQALNYNYKKDLLVIPQALIQEEVAVVPGLDGRKMSKSYNNTIPLFVPEKQLRKLIMRIVTNSQTVEEPKDPDKCQIFALYKLFATAEEQAQLAQRYRAGGMGWGEAKEALFQVMNRELTPIRERYEAYMANPAELDRILAEGAEKARAIARQTIQRLRRAIGIEW
ncbi:MAG: tryptophan--tRNA ligase [Treponemataceae bacterium]|uniref:tryptophan--tRNA ligase n=1 Tax=Treponema sp. J25 TaxID=2094121 RepID=UPI0010513D64|nr:tryptophan--tRNA ligase [Treponema sp. J25]MCX7948735.1 tryptophan--tRNA ligase [Treponemataceae bacterium]TCW61133.1 tryptophan--tRNA ligase [Treponema sp. J25]